MKTSQEYGVSAEEIAGNFLHGVGSAKHDPHCERCRNPVKLDTAIWYELDARTGKYVKTAIPEEHSQGWFVFGPECGKRPNAPFKGW